jgi:luciferase family oxidoreductase group 1
MMAPETKLRLSVLDLSPISAGSSGAEALRNTLDLARLTDTLGYTRYWVAEHHNTAFIASAVPEVMIGHIAQVTRHMRIGSGGVMLPNHAPLKVAETFRTLEALHPGRIDLGLGRAPGTDPLTAFALRRSREAMAANDFPEQLAELLAFFGGEFPEDHPFRRITAIPGDAPAPEIWLLGSSGFSAQLAAELGLGFVFAHHINPEPAAEALRIYRERFRPSVYNEAPRSLVATSVICAETDEKADELARPMDLTRLLLEQGRLRPLPTVEEATDYPYNDFEREHIRANRARAFIGSPETLRERLTDFAERTGVEEVMAMTMTHGHAERRESYTLLAEAFKLTPPV